jgi:hypothetical protein
LHHSTDVDGVMTKHRTPFQYHKLHLDVVNIAIAEIMKRLSNTDTIIICTGRPQSCEADTLLWIKSKLDGFVPQEIHSRKNGDSRADYLVKEEMWSDIQQRYRIIAMFDDRNQVVNHARALKHVVCQVDEGNF